MSNDGERRHILNAMEAAKFLRLSQSTLNGRRLTGGGPAFVRLGRRIFYQAPVLERFVQDKTYPHTCAYGRGTQCLRLERSGTRIRAWAVPDVPPIMRENGRLSEKPAKPRCDFDNLRIA